MFLSTLVSFFYHFNILTCFIVFFILCVKRLQYFALKPYFIILHSFVEWHGWHCVFMKFHMFALAASFTAYCFYSFPYALDTWQGFDYIVARTCILYHPLYYMYIYYILYTISFILYSSCILYNLMRLEFWEELSYFALITCFTMLSFSYIISLLDFWESLHWFVLTTYFTISHFCYIAWVTIIFLLFIVEYCSVLHF